LIILECFESTESENSERI